MRLTSFDKKLRHNIVTVAVEQRPAVEWFECFFTITRPQNG